MKAARYLLLAALVVGLPAFRAAAAKPADAQPLRAAPLGPIVEAPDGKSEMELVRFDESVTAKLQTLAPEETLRVDDWPVSPGRRAQVVLRRFDVYAPDAKIVVIEDGVEREAPRSNLAFFQGEVLDGIDAGSRFATWIDPETAEVESLSVTAHGTVLIAAPDARSGGRPRLAAAEALVPAGSTPSWSCAAPDDEFEVGALGVRSGASSGASVSETLRSPISVLGTLTKTAVIAFDTDAEYLNLRFSNNTTSAANYIGQLVAGMTVIYERDAGTGNGNGVRILQGYTILRVGEAGDPYNDTAGGVVSNDPRLTEFSSYWNANYPGYPASPNTVIQRALGALLSGRQGGSCSMSGCSASGIASLSGLCNSNGYSLNLLFNVAFPINYDLSILAHEIGHNFGAYHTHNCTYGTPPIDTCIAAEGGCAAQGSCPTAQTINGVSNVTGTLMSYCHLRGDSCTSSLVFHPLSVTGTNGTNGILDNILAAPCFSSLVGGVVPAAPTITNVAPATGPLAGGSVLTITGTNFVNGPPTVAFVELPSNDVFGTPNSKVAASVTFINSTQLTVTTPSATNLGAVDVVVMNPDRQTATRASGFTYSATPPAPTVTAISPNTGSTAGGTSVTITGTGFVSTPATPSVVIGGVNATAEVFVNATTLTATVPAHAAGLVNVVVTNPDAQSGTLTNGYAYLPPPSASRYYVLTPCRLFDTRNTTILAANETRTFDVSGLCSVPDTALALTVNATVTGSGAAGELRFFPGNGLSPNPPASTLFYAAGKTRANNSTIRLSTDGTATLKVQNVSAGAVHFILDVSGYYRVAP